MNIKINVYVIFKRPTVVQVVYTNGLHKSSFTYNTGLKIIIRDII